MGYIPESTVYKLKFTQPKYAGLEVRVRPPTGAAIRDFNAMDKPDTVDRQLILVGHFADALIDWNVQNRDGQPVPATRDDVFAQDYVWLIGVMEAWLETILHALRSDAQRAAAGANGTDSVAGTIPVEPMPPAERAPQIWSPPPVDESRLLAAGWSE